MPDPEYMKERLRRLKERPGWAFKPLDKEFLNKMEPSKVIKTPETEMQNKIEKAMKKVEDIRNKMKDASNYLSLYYDLKKAQDEFLQLVDEMENGNFLDFPDSFVKRVNNFKSGLRIIR